MTNDYLGNRYGRTKVRARNQRLIWISVGSALALIFLIWSISVNFIAAPTLSATVQSFNVVSPQQTQVTIHVNNPTARDGFCTVQLLDKGFNVVGYREQTIAGANGKSTTMQVSVNTTSLGVSANVDRCWLK